MFSNTRHYHSRSLTLGLSHHYLTHNARVLIVEMAYWLVSKQKVEGLHKGTDESHSLLMSK